MFIKIRSDIICSVYRRKNIYIYIYRQNVKWEKVKKKIG